MYAEPQTLHLLLGKLADSVIEYLNALEIKAGAQSVMVFDTWGGVLDCLAITTSSRYSYMHKIVDGLDS